MHNFSEKYLKLNYNKGNLDFGYSYKLLVICVPGWERRCRGLM
jgi:hypothetical protein